MTEVLQNVKMCSGICAVCRSLAFGRTEAVRVTILITTLELCQGDITAEPVDAIVNAANPRLAGGGGVDGAIHQAGGPTIMAETAQRYPDGCPTGSAVISAAGRLPARHVIHAVGPVWQGGKANEPALLAGAVRRSLELAVEAKCQSLALPALSTGAYGYPVDLAAQVTLATTLQHLREHQAPALVRIVLFASGPYGAFVSTLESLLATDSGAAPH